MYTNNKYFDPILKIRECLFQISNMTIAFSKILHKNTQIRHFWFQISSFLVLPETLHLDEFESAFFKYNNSILKLLPKTLK